MMRNEVYRLHHVLVFGFSFFLLCMNTMLLVSSATELVVQGSNKTMVITRCIETERHALLDIKQSLTDPHGLLSSWGGSKEKEDCCEWSGVGCDRHTGHVTYLNLSNVNYDTDYSYNHDNYPNYKISISASLIRLAKLKYLDLSKNEFAIPIPSFIGSLTNLVHLDLSDNFFEGAIPHELWNISRLQYLNLGSNDLLLIDSTDVLFHLSSLVFLDLSGIYIDPVNSGSWLNLIYKLPLLSELRLNSCDLTSIRAPSISFANSSATISVLHLFDNKLDSSIFNWISTLGASLVDLDVSFNHLKGHIPKSFANMTAMTNLDLSNNYLNGVVPTNSLFHMVTLTLNTNRFTSTIFDWVSNMSTTLEYLDLRNNMMHGQIPETFSVDKLRKLDLSDNLLHGHIPNSFGVMTGMTHLDLSRNQLQGVLPNIFRYLPSLQFVNFGYNNLTGNLEDLMYVLPKAALQVLWISENQLTGSVPDITRFSSLKVLKVDSNLLNGYLPKEFEYKSALQLLDLSNNFLQGFLPNFTGFSLLKKLVLNHNRFSGSLPDFTGCLSLQNLLLDRNRFSEWKTQSIGQLTNLYLLNISLNLISSTIHEHHLSKLYSLRLMDASFNSLKFNMSSEWLPLFKLNRLYLASCKLGPKFPMWIQNQTEMMELSLSNTQISDTIPLWFWDISTSMERVDLSSNKIIGTLSSIHLDFEEIDLSYNYFDGPIPSISEYCSKINLSQNKFSGELFFTTEALMGWGFFDVSHNFLFGEVPDSWIYFQDLLFLDLGNNNFSGRIPKSIGYLASLQTLILRNNSLEGELPSSLRNCTKLGFVDFGFNSLSGTVPEWIGKNLPQLYGLVLKSNKFYGRMPYDLCHLSNLRFLDLSLNRISGEVPQCFSNLSAMIKNGTGITEHYYNGSGVGNYTDPRANSYIDDALAGWKGKEQEFRRNLMYLKMIDLSSNDFTGEIPIGITRLLDLNGLNLSRNKFYGEVPVEIGKLFKLENLDLSSNNFSGEIPRSMSGLTFLSYLDLSSNNLSGRIPLGSQLQSFDSSAYEGNAGLCGIPLTKKCPGDETTVESEPLSKVDEEEIVYERWLYISVALGFSTGFCATCATLFLNTQLRHAYFIFLIYLKDQLYVFVAVQIARLKLRLQV